MGKGKSRKEPTRVQEIRHELGLEASTEFVGYGIQRPDTEEFLALADMRPDIEQWGWTPFPDFARRFTTVGAARRIARRYDKPTIIVYMFDTGPQYVVAVDR